MELLQCAFYVAVLGVVSNLAGQLLPRKWFNPETFPFRSFSWENGGRIYEKLCIRRWKDKLPDASRFVPTMYRKQVSTTPNGENLRRMAQETCVAETVHWVLILLSLVVVKIWEGRQGWLCWCACLLGNFPFILIQRFNRPRLCNALRRLRSQRIPAVAAVSCEDPV